jgi:adenylyltransferase/sulfurtransferase
MTPDEQLRYARQLTIAEIGPDGQKKLKSSRVFIAGLGGLGSAAAYYLAAAGVGGLTIVDGDRVEMGNLNRQILYATRDIGSAKTSVAFKKLEALNPGCGLRPIQARIGDENLASLLGGSAVILDATDNMATRQVLNRASLDVGIPLIYGGIDGFSGMVCTFIPGSTCCLECLFPGPPKLPAPGPAGALGPVAGLVATTQCLEAIKLLLGLAPALAGRLLQIDTLKMTFRHIDINRNPYCTVCG